MSTRENIESLLSTAQEHVRHDPDGDHLDSASDDPTAQPGDAETGMQIAPLFDSPVKWGKKPNKNRT